MNTKTQNKLSNLLSVLIHAAFFIAFVFFTYEPEQQEDEFVTVGFGTFGQGNSGTRNTGEMIPDLEKDLEETTVPEKPSEKIEETKDVKLPETKNDEAELINKKEEDKKKNETSPDKKKADDKKSATSESVGEGEGESGDGTGATGFEIAWGGSGTRKIYSYELPAYPDGVSKEIDIKLKFSILPDGSVGKIIPLMKADTRLEMAAINSLRNWRFEPLRTGQKKIEQSVIIIFPYRLQ